jgi:hypothetical protein
VTLVLATLIDTDALWKIVLATFAGGVGLTAIYGFLLTRAQAAAEARRRGATGAAALNSALVAACGLICAAALVVGFLAMMQK